MSVKHWMLSLFFVGFTGCSKTETVNCGPGTVLEGNTCVAVPTAVPAKPPQTIPVVERKKPTIGCSEACKKGVTCKGLNADAPLVVNSCANFCKEVETAAVNIRETYLQCMQDASCSSYEVCGQAFAKATAPKPRDAKEDDAIVITKASLGEGEYGVGKNLYISYKNTTDKPVDGVKLVYFCSNNFDDPVGSGKLIAQDVIGPKAASRGVWKIYENTCTKMKATVFEVHFKDGTKWVADQ